MPKQEEFQKDQHVTKEQATSGTLYVAGCLSLVTQTFLRFCPGIKALNLKVLIVAVAMPYWAMASHSPMVFLYWKIWLVSLPVYKLFQDRTEHSRFIGRPWLTGIFIEGFRPASLVEAFLVIGIGFMVRDWGLSRMLIASGAASLVLEIAQRHLDEQERIAREDAAILMGHHTQNLRR